MIKGRIKDLGEQMVKVILENMGQKVTSVTFSAYSPSGEEFEDRVPYLEIKVEVDSTEELLKLWDEVIEILRKHFSREELEKIDIFLARTDDENGNEEG
jgi:hypothetical protein